MFDIKSLKKYVPLATFFCVYSSCFIVFMLACKYMFPLVVGFVLSLILQPIIDLLIHRLHLNRGFAAFISTVLIFTVIFGAMWMAIYFLINEMITLMYKLSQMDIGYIVNPAVELIQKTAKYAGEIDLEFINENRKQLFTLAQNSIGIITTVLKSSVNLLTSLPMILTVIITMVFSTYFFSKDMKTIKLNIKKLIPSHATQQINDILQHAGTMLTRYLISYFLICFVTFVQTLIIFLFLGVKYPLTLSIISGVIDVLPIIGPTCVYIPIAIFYFLSKNYFTAIGVSISLFIIMLIRQLIEPRIISYSIDVHPLILLAIIYVSLATQSLVLFTYLIILVLLYKVIRKTSTKIN